MHNNNKRLKDSFFVFCILAGYVYLVCAVPLEARRGHGIPLELELQELSLSKICSGNPTQVLWKARTLNHGAVSLALFIFLRNQSVGLERWLSIKSTGYSSRGPEFNSHHPRGNSLLMTIVPRDPVPSSSVHMYIQTRQNILVHK